MSRRPAPIAALVALLGGLASSPSPAMTQQPIPSTPTATAIRFGRISLALPAGTLAEGEAQLGPTQLRETRLDPAGALDMDSLWTARLAAARAAPSPGRPGARDPILSQRRSGGVRLLQRRDDADGEVEVVEALVEGLEGALWLTASYEADAREEITAEVEALARSFRPKAGHAPDPSDFHLLHGVLSGARPTYETTRLTLSHPALGAELEVDSDLPGDPDLPGLLEGWEEILALGGELGVQNEPLRMTPRTVNGLSGEEVLMRTGDEGRVRLSFQWRHHGSGMEDPDLSVSMTAPDRHRAAAVAFWDALVGSIELIR